MTQPINIRAHKINRAQLAQDGHLAVAMPRKPGGRYLSASRDAAGNWTWSRVADASDAIRVELFQLTVQHPMAKTAAVFTNGVAAALAIPLDRQRDMNFLEIVFDPNDSDTAAYFGIFAGFEP